MNVDQKRQVALMQNLNHEGECFDSAEVSPNKLVNREQIPFMQNKIQQIVPFDQLVPTRGFSKNSREGLERASEISSQNNFFEAVWKLERKQSSPLGRNLRRATSQTRVISHSQHAKRPLNKEVWLNQDIDQKPEERPSVEYEKRLLETQVKNEQQKFKLRQLRKETDRVAAENQALEANTAALERENISLLLKMAQLLQQKT